MPTHQQTKYRWMALSFSVSILLLLTKLTAYYLTSSTAILTDALESIVNVVASGFAFYSIYLSGQPRDTNHPYGHGKIEFFSSGFEGGLIVMAGFFISYQAFQSFFEPIQVANLDWGIALIAVATAVNAMLGWGLIRVGRQTHSLALKADGRHLLTDGISSLVVIVGVGLVWLTGKLWIDSALALALSLLIIYNGWQLVRQSVAGLMDETDAPTLIKVVETLNLNKKPVWIDVHNLRVQKYGADLHIDCHLTLPYYLELKDAHDEVNRFENILKNGFPAEVEIFVHADPCLKECCHYCRLDNCPVRQFPFVQDVAWTARNLTVNQKHFVPFQNAIPD